MRNRKFWAGLLTLALCLTMLAPVALADTIKIGGIAPLSGNLAAYGQGVRDGVDLYIKQLNDAGGIDGNLVEILWEDEQGDTNQAISAFNKLVEQDNVVAIIGDVTSTPTLAIGELAVEIGIPMITASATNYDVTTDKPNYFRSCFLDPFQAQVMANYAKDEFQAATAAVFYDVSDDYNTGLAEAFRARAGEIGIEIVAYEGSAGSDVDFKSQLTSITAKQPDILYLPFYYEAAALIIRQAQEVGLDVPVLGADGFDGLKSVLDDNALLANVVYTNHYSAEEDRQQVQDFLAGFTAEYGQEPWISFNATGYDAALILCEAIAQASAPDNYEEVCAAIKNGSFECVTGTIIFDDHNDPIKSAFIIGFDADGARYLRSKIAPSL